MIVLSYLASFVIGYWFHITLREVETMYLHVSTLLQVADLLVLSVTLTCTRNQQSCTRRRVHCCCCRPGNSTLCKTRRTVSRRLTYFCAGLPFLFTYLLDISFHLQRISVFFYLFIPHRLHCIHNLPLFSFKALTAPSFSRCRSGF